MVDGFPRLRHHPVVGRDDEDDDVGHLRAAGAHQGERLVTRRVEEHDVPVVDGHVIRADVLRDAAGFALGDACFADSVEQTGLAVIDVAHHRDDRRAHDDILGTRVVLVDLQQFLFEAAERHLGAELTGDHGRRFGIERRVDGEHEPLHQQLGEHVLHSKLELVREVLHRHALGEHDRARDRRRRRWHRRRGRTRVAALTGRRASLTTLAHRRSIRHPGPLRILVLPRTRRQARRAACEPAATEEAAGLRPAPADANRGTRGVEAAEGRPDAREPYPAALPALAAVRQPFLACPGAPAAGRGGAGMLGRSTLGRCTTRGAGAVGNGGVGVVGRCSSMRSRKVGGTMRPAAGFGGGAGIPGIVIPGDAASGASTGGVTGSGASSTGGSACGSRSTCSTIGSGASASIGGAAGSASPMASASAGTATGRPDGLDEAWRRQRGSRGLDRLGRLLRRRALLAFDDVSLREDVAARQRNVALTRETLDELARDDFLDGARGALHLDAVVALEQRRDFLARGGEQFRDFENPDSGQAVSLFRAVAADLIRSALLVRPD